MKSIKSIAIILLSLFCVVYGTLLSFMGIFFLELEPFIYGVILIGCGYIPLFKLSNNLDDIASDIL